MSKTHRNSRWPPKVAGKRFFGKSPVDSADTLWVKNFVEIALSHFISEINGFFAFSAEIQDGRQKWWENDFCKKSPVDSPHSQRVKNFVEIALSNSVSEMNGFLRLTQKFKMAAKSGGEMIFAKSHQ